LNFIQHLCYRFCVAVPFPVNRTSARASEHPLLRLEEDDLDFVVQFMLVSGSLKDMAQLYGVSYPTIRASLDRVIANLRQSLSGAPPDALTGLLADLVERGEIKPGIAKSIRAAHRDAMEKAGTRAGT
jgi:hypothetical protein